MNKFVKQILLFAMPLLIMSVSFEILLRNIPNDYQVKKKYLDRNSDSIRVLVLGSSYAFYGINPVYFTSKSFNASHVSQSLDYDFEILKKYEKQMRNLESIVLPISYFSLYGNLETGNDAWRVRNYTIYYGMNSSKKFVDYTEAFSSKLMINVIRIYTYYIKGNSNISCSDLGWGVDFTSKNKQDLNATGKIAAKRHATSNDKYFTENSKVLKKIIELAKVKKVKVFLFTPPAFRTYTANLDSAKLNKTIFALMNFDQKYDNVSYVNLLSDTSFSEEDFYDADHLNEVGAKKLTMKVDSIISKY